MDDLVDLSVVVRRVIAARVQDTHLVEDLTQETLVHVATADPRLSPGARQAYAIVTARNLVVSHARSQAVHDRHAHRLVEYTTLDGPEQLSLEREETQALAVALERLPADDRDLLLRHDVEGTTTDTLAGEADTTSGAVAMRLARARAALRLNFVLILRRVELPTKHCRPVLLALSAGDRRGQARLDAAGHLLRCATCGQLAQPLTERRRAIAVWLIAPLAAAVRWVATSLRRNHITQLAVTIAALAAGVTTFAANRPDDTQPAAGPGTSAVPVSPPPSTVANAPSPAVVAVSPTRPTGPVPVPATTSTAAPSTTTMTTVDSGECPAPVALDQLDPTTPYGCPIGPSAVNATEVPADEGFWAQPASGPPVWVQLIGEGESAVDIQAGSTLRIATATLRPPAAGTTVSTDPRTLTTGYILDVPFDAITPG